MEWLRKLLLGSGSHIVPRYGAAQEEPDPIDWHCVEDELVTLAEEQIQAFAASHASESFYGFGFDCDSNEGQVLLCLNSRAAQIEAAQQTLSRHPDLYQGESEQEVARSIEWGFGDWKYQGFNLRSKTWSKRWRRVEILVGNALNMLGMNRKAKAMQELRESFMEMACRALHRVGSSRSITMLRRDSDFRTLCADHDEGPEDGFTRMARIAGRGV